MSKQKKILGIILFVLVGYIAYGIFSYIGKTQFGFVYPNGSFLFAPADQYMDFFNVNQMVYHRNPYVGYYSSYPPFILWIAWFFSRIGNYDVFNSYQMVTQTEGKVAIGIFWSIFTLAILSILFVWFREHKDSFKNPLVMLLAMGCVTFTAPFWFMIDRGNYLLVAIACYTAFIFFYERNPRLAAIFLGLAISIKIYPIFLFALYFVEKRWKEMGIATLTAGITSGITLLFFEGGIWENIRAFGGALLSFGGGSANEVPNVYFGVGLTSFLRYPFVVYNELTIPEWFPVMLVYLIFGSALALFTMFNTRNEQKTWKKLTIFTALMVFLSPNAYMYNLTFFLPILALFMLESDGTTKVLDIAYLVIMGLIMIPKAYHYVLPGHLIGIQVFLDGFLLLSLVLLYNFGDRKTRIKVEKKQQS